MSDWRKSAKADELREFIDKSFSVKKPSLGGLDRELVIDFVAKEVDAVGERAVSLLNLALQDEKLSEACWKRIAQLNKSLLPPQHDPTP